MLRIDQVLVPPRRLGGLLRESRVAAGEELAEVASRSRRLTATDLDDIEHGRRTVGDGVLADLIEIYALEGAELLPERSRLVIDLDEGLISVDSAEVTVADHPEPEAVLVRYLALVHRLRDVPVGTELKIRELDVEVLATALELEGSDVERRLRRLMGGSQPLIERERDLRHRLVLPLAGVVVAATAVGVLLLVSDDPGEVGPSDSDRVLVQVPEQPRENDSEGADRMVSREASSPGDADGLSSPGEQVPVAPDVEAESVEPTPAPPPGAGISEPAARPAEPETSTAEPAAVDPQTAPDPVATAETEIIDAAIVESGGEQTTRD